MQNKKGFTLVELIVVITILAILGTIAFLSFQGYSKSARDSTRVSDLNSIETALELFALQTGYYPEPTNPILITFSGSEVWRQGTVGNGVVGQVQRLNKKPVDPLTGSEYTYSRLNTRKEIELAATLEEGNLATTAQTYAGEKVGYAHITGNYNGLVAKVSTGSQTYMLAVPTIINADLDYTTYNSVLSNNKLVIDGKDNLPDSYDGTTFKMNTGYEEGITDPVVYNSGNTLPSNEDEVLTFITNLQDTYSGSTINTSDVLSLVSQTNQDQLLILGKSIVQEEFGGTITTIITSNQSSITYTTWDPENYYSGLYSLSNNNLTVNEDAGGPTSPVEGSVRSVVGKNSGKWYWEITVDSYFDSPAIGVVKSTVDMNSYYFYTNVGGIGYWSVLGRVVEDGDNINYLQYDSYTTNDVIGVALDLDNNAIWFSKNGVWQQGATIEEIQNGNLANATSSSLNGTYHAFIGDSSTGSPNWQLTANFGALDFAYGVPNGFNAGLYE